MPRALVTGVTGQDGLYLSELLLAKGYEVYGVVRDPASPKAETVRAEVPDVRLVRGDLTDLPSLIAAVEEARPDEVYNLAALSFVVESWVQAEVTAETTGMGVLRVLEALRTWTGGDMSRVRFYQASSSEVFGNVEHSPQDERTAFRPRSPYGVAKTFGHYITVNYREMYGAFACSGFLYNHESPRRGAEFVTRKITRAVARIARGEQETVTLGNLDACRDWGYAGDYVEAMWLMLQQPEPDDYVVATGVTHSIRDVLRIAFGRAGIEDWESRVKQDPALVRAAEAHPLVGDATKARERLGWVPRVSFEELIAMMADADLAHTDAHGEAPA